MQQNSVYQERQGVPARWGHPARGIPTAKPPTVRESSSRAGTPYPLPLPKEVQKGGRGPGRRGGSRLEGG